MRRGLERDVGMRPFARKTSLLLALAVGFPTYAQIANSPGDPVGGQELEVSSPQNQLPQHARLVDS
jgi:hypothetical protein